MPLYRRLPKRGFKRIHKRKIAILNISDLNIFFKNNKINLKDEINIKSLAEKNLIAKKYNKLKILGKGEIKEKIKITTDFISKSARSKIEKAGGLISMPKQKNI